jgi:hypothetical protein
MTITQDGRTSAQARPPAMFGNLEPMLTRLTIAPMLSPILFFGLLMPACLVAQDAAYFQALSVPPRSVGTCVPAAPQRNLPDSVTTEPRLVITSVAPAIRREILVIRNVKSHVVVFSEIVSRSTDSGSGTGDYVVAIIDAAGRVRGARLRTAMRMSNSAVSRPDTASIRAMTEHAARQSSREPLDAKTQRKVQKLVDWMRTRCPT